MGSLGKKSSDYDKLIDIGYDYIDRSRRIISEAQPCFLRSWLLLYGDSIKYFG